MPETGAPTKYSPRIRVAPPVVELPDEETSRRLAELAAAVQAAEAAVQAAEEGARGEEQRVLDAARRAYEGFKGDRLPRVMVMSDYEPRETRVLDRGDYLSPQGDPLTFTPPAFLPPLPESFPRDRLGLARWLFLP